MNGRITLLKKKKSLDPSFKRDVWRSITNLQKIGGYTVLICEFCGASGTEEDDDFQLDSNGFGFWCEDCDGFTYFDQIKNRHRFTLILEKKEHTNEPLVITDQKFNKRLSPYRYPGGKSKIVQYLYSHLQIQNSKTKKLISPFAGGASFELAMLHAGVIEELHLNDLDLGVFALWWTIKYMPFEIIERIRTITPNHQDYFKAQSIIKNDYLGVDLIEAAWSSLLVNRLAYSGIVKANPLGGKNGGLEKLLSRWNPKELIRKIEYIHSVSDRIEVTQENAIDLIEEAYWQDEATIFIDPPYVQKGKDLYHCFYTEKDHRELSFLLDSLHYGCPGADIIVTYDYNKWLNGLYEYPKVEVIGRIYSA